METFYTIQRNTKILVALMKEHNVRKIFDKKIILVVGGSGTITLHN